MLWIILIVLLVIWLGGFLLDVVGGLIHIILIVALAVLIYQLVTGRRAA